MKKCKNNGNENELYQKVSVYTLNTYDSITHICIRSLEASMFIMLHL